MFRFCYITDIHLRSTAPISRSDNFCDTLFRKLEWVLEYARSKRVDVMVCGGDVLDTPSPSDETVNRFLEMICKYKIPWYSIYGNHDLKTPTNHSKIGLIEHCKFWHHLVDEPIVREDFCIYGIDYSKELEAPDHIELKGIEDKEYKILVLHSMVSGKTMIVGPNRKMVAFGDLEITPKFDMILTGHYHPGYGIQKIETCGLVTLWANIGSMMRLSTSEAKSTVGPGVGYGCIGKGRCRAFKYVVIPHDKNVFDLEGKVGNIDHQEVRDLFVRALKEFSTNSLTTRKPEEVIKKIVEKMGKQKSVTDELVKDICRKIEEERNV